MSALQPWFLTRQWTGPIAPSTPEWTIYICFGFEWEGVCWRHVLEGSYHLNLPVLNSCLQFGDTGHGDCEGACWRKEEFQATKYSDAGVKKGCDMS
jgi:hypothetical protein